jgi:hypothetical protein
MKFYHITHKENSKKIISEGLKANEDGQIFLFENKSIQLNNVINCIADCIARNQLFLNEYIMFEVDSLGFETELIRDNVAEITAQKQWILYQSFVSPDFVCFYGKFKTEYKPFFNI